MTNRRTIRARAARRAMIRRIYAAVRPLDLEA